MNLGFVGVRQIGWRVCLLVLLLFLGLGSSTAIASVHEYVEGPDQVMYRSLQTLRDRANRAWQVVVFKRLKDGQVESLNLRLVGFPEVAELEHPHPLQLTTGTENVWEAADLLSGPAPTLNVGEYDLREVMAQLDSNTPLRLAVPTKERQVELLVPPFVVQEWREIAAK